MMINLAFNLTAEVTNKYNMVRNNKNKIIRKK